MLPLPLPLPFALSSLFLLTTPPTPSLPTTIPLPPRPTTAPFPSLVIPPAPSLSPLLLLFLLLLQRKGRQFIRPEICRTLHFGQHGVSDAQYSDVRTNIHTHTLLLLSSFFFASLPLFLSSLLLISSYFSTLVFFSSVCSSTLSYSLPSSSLFSFPLHLLYSSLLIYDLLLLYSFFHGMPHSVTSIPFPFPFLSTYRTLN